MGGILSKLYRKFYVKLIPDSFETLRSATVGCESLLDVGCGASSPVKYCTNKMHKVGVDAYKPSIEESRKQKIHDEYVVADIMEIGKRFKPKSFDCVVAFDVIEHLEKKDGYKFLQMMEKIAKKRVIVFTPNGFLPQGALYGNEHQIHRSGWTWKEMEDRGYKVTGINGWKPLRGELALPRIRPHILGMLISDFTQLFTKNKPKHAFQIFCVKEIR